MVGQVFWAVNFLLLFLVPMITMRLLAEEKKSGTFELLKSLPFTDWNIVLAKFLAAYALVAGMLLLSGYYVLIMMRFGQPEMPVVRRRSPRTRSWRPSSPSCCSSAST